MHETISMLHSLIASGNYGGFLITLFNQYFPFGIFFWMIGILLFIISHIKTKNLVFSGGILATYLMVVGYSGVVTNIYSTELMKWGGIIIGIMVGWYIYRAFKGG